MIAEPRKTDPRIPASAAARLAAWHGSGQNEVRSSREPVRTSAPHHHEIAAMVQGAGFDSTSRARHRAAHPPRASAPCRRWPRPRADRPRARRPLNISTTIRALRAPLRWRRPCRNSIMWSVVSPKRTLDRWSGRRQAAPLRRRWTRAIPRKHQPQREPDPDRVALAQQGPFDHDHARSRSPIGDLRREKTDPPGPRPDLGRIRPWLWIAPDSPAEPHRRGRAKRPARMACPVARSSGRAENRADQGGKEEHLHRTKAPRCPSAPRRCPRQRSQKGAISAKRSQGAMAGSARLASGRAISAKPARPRASPARRRAENRSIPRASAMGKANIGHGGDHDGHDPAPGKTPLPKR